MTPSSVTLLTVLASYLEWRLSPWAGRVLRVRTGRTATGTSLSTTEGVFNGGAWLEVDGRRSNVHYRDLDTIDREIAASREGRFDIEPLMFHLAGLPSYLVAAVVGSPVGSPDSRKRFRGRRP